MPCSTPFYIKDLGIHGFFWKVGITLRLRGREVVIKVCYPF